MSSLYRRCFAITFPFLAAMVVAIGSPSPWIAIAHCGTAPVEDEKEKPPAYPTETALLKIKLTDQDGKPVVGAKVYCYAMRCKEDQGSHYGWPAENVGPSPTLISDPSGMVQVKYPVRFGRPTEWLTTTQLSLSIRHAEFVATEIHVDPSPGEIDEKMKAGCELSVSVQDLSLQSTLNFGILMAGPGGSANWLVTDEPGRRSRAIPPGIWQTMLVSPQENGVTLFSGVLPLKLRESQSVTIRNMPLKPGLRLEGKLSDNVVRPVKEGKVLVHCLPKPQGRVHDDKDPTLAWEETATIQEDGTFVFPSLPKTGKMQFIAICRGYVVQSQEQNENRGAHVQGVLMEVDSLEENEPIVIEMEETGDLAVRVTKPDGEPLVGAEIATWPNQIMELSGSNVLGEAWNSIDEIRRQIDPSIKSPARQVPTRFAQKTDKNGMAILRDIPLKTRESLNVEHAQYRIPIQPGKVNNYLPYVLNKSGITELPILVEAIPEGK